MSVKPWDLLNKNNYTEEEISKERLDICNGCPSFIPLTTTCKECGCFMKLKTKVKEATCPLGKW